MDYNRKEALELLYKHNSIDFIEEYGLNDMFSVCDTSNSKRCCPTCETELPQDFYDKTCYYYCKTCYSNKSKIMTIEQKKERSKKQMEYRKKRSAI